MNLDEAIKEIELGDLDPEGWEYKDAMDLIMNAAERYAAMRYWGTEATPTWSKLGWEEFMIDRVSEYRKKR